MAKSKFDIGDLEVIALNLGDEDVKAHLGDTLLYPLSKPIDDAVVTCASATYNGSNQVAQDITVTLSGVTLVENTDYTVTQNTGGTNVGSYDVTVTGIGDYESTARGTFTINKVTPTVVAPTPKVLTYNGSAQELVTAGSTNFGTLKYKVGSDSWSTSIPTRTRGGAYTVYFKVDGDSNVNSVAEDTVACSINEKPVTAVVTLSPASYTYSGSYCEPSVTVKDGETIIDPSEYTVTYSNNLNAGTATVTIYDVVGGDYYVTGSTTFTISKADPTYTAPTAKTGLVYNTSDQALLNAGSATGGTIYYSSDGSTWGTAIPSGTNATSYTSYWKITGDANHNDKASASISTTIAQASTCGTAPTAKSLTYTGSGQALVNAGSSSCGTMQYATASTGTYSTTIPSGTTAGTYTTYWKVANDSNHSGTSSGSVSTTIAKAAMSYTAPKPTTYTYDGNSKNLLSGASATGGSIQYSPNNSSWSTTIPTGTGATTYTSYWKAVPDNNHSGGTSSASISTTIAKADQPAPTATGATTTYPTTATATASGGGGQGSIEWESAQSQSSVGSHTTRARWSGNSNYNASPYSSYVTVQMNKAAGSVTTAPVNNNYTYNGTARAVASAGSGTGTMYYRLGTSGSFSTTMPTMTNASSSTLYYYAAASTNYEQSSTGSITVSVQKANISPTVSISNWTYGGTASNPSVAGNSGSGTVTYYYKLSSASSWSTTKPSDAGSYNIKADIAATANYNSGTCTNNFTINKASRTLSWTNSPENVGCGDTVTILATPSAGSGDGAITYASSNSNIASINGSTVSGKTIGSCVITATIAAGSNYLSATTSYTLTVIDPCNGHDYVEIGGIKWATMNVGASSVTDYGQYFQWGDTTGYLSGNVGTTATTWAKPFSWADYKFSGGRTSPDATGMTKYNSNDGKTVLDICDDAARLNWGGSWRMPTTEEFEALGNAVNTAWTYDYQGSGVRGLVCTDKTDSSKVLFFPAAGFCKDGSRVNVDIYGCYWFSSLYSSDVQKAYNSFFRSSLRIWNANSTRNYGYPVRGVVG